MNLFDVCLIARDNENNNNLHNMLPIEAPTVVKLITTSGYNDFDCFPYSVDQ